MDVRGGCVRRLCRGGDRFGGGPHGSPRCCVKGGLMMERTRSAHWLMAMVVILVLGVACVGTGVRDYRGWRAAIDNGEPCSELFDIKSRLPESVDLAKVEADLR